MKKLITTDIVGTVKMPVMGRTLDHLQEAHQETADAICKGMHLDPTRITILYGCVNTGDTTDYVISAGAVYYNGEIFMVDAATFSVVGPDTAICLIEETYQAGDPTAFTDGSSHNVHLIRKMKIQGGSSGTTGYISTYAVITTEWILLPDAPNYLISGDNRSFIMKDRSGFVHFKGRFSADDPDPDHLIGTLPVGYRPTEQLEFSLLVSITGTEPFGTVLIKIGLDGVIRFEGGSTATMRLQPFPPFRVV
jgi:hypothetical protein